MVDPSTEFRMVRLTDPAHASFLPDAANRAVARRGQFVVFSSDRAGALQPHRTETGSGESRQIVEAEGLHSETLTLAADEKTVFFTDARGVHRTAFSGRGRGSAREIYRWTEGCEPGRGLGVSIDGLYAAVVERKAGKWRLRLAEARGEAATLAESDDELSMPLVRPRRESVLYRRGGALWLVNFDGRENRKLPLAPGGLGTAMWSVDGKTVVYLNLPEDAARAVNIREIVPDANQERWVTDTSKFAAFSQNGDGSVFAGASASKASPFVSLLLRRAHRELTVAEHRASDARLVTTMFSPNSQRLFFQTDREGKMAVYMMNVERLVAETEA